MNTHPIGAPGSIARYLSDAARDGVVFPAPFVVLGYRSSANKVEEFARGRTREMVSDRFERLYGEKGKPREWRLVDVREHGCKVAEVLPGVPRCGDTVFHRPMGAELGVAWADEKSGDFSWFGWPDGIGRLSDCDLVEKVTDEEHRKAVDEWLARLRDGNGDSRSRRVRDLYRPQFAEYLACFLLPGGGIRHFRGWADDEKQAEQLARAALRVPAYAVTALRKVREELYVSELDGLLRMLRGANVTHEIASCSDDAEVVLVQVNGHNERLPTSDASTFTFVRKHLVRFDR